MNKRIYIDMDGVLCNFMKRFRARGLITQNPYPQSEFDFFRKLEEMPRAVDSVFRLSANYDVWILTRPSFRNPLCYTEKRVWIEEHLGIEWCEKLIISPDKSLLIGDILIDDHPWPKFQGRQILFGSEEYPDWNAVIDELDYI